MTFAWNAETLWEQLEPLLPGVSVEVVDHCVSTNSVLLERARAFEQAPDAGIAQVRRSRESAAFGRRAADVLPCLLVAEHQSGGRGRLGRTWTSSRGASLTFSLSLPVDTTDWSGLSLAVGVALADALDPSPPGVPRIGLKWPNDLWLLDHPGGRGRKLGGILIETAAVGHSRMAVIGVGLNVLPQHGAGESVDTAPDYASLHELDAQVTAPDTLARVAMPLAQAIVAFRREGFKAFAERFAARDLLRGLPITTTQAGLPQGVAQGVGPDGALRVESADGRVHDVTSGEVSVRLQATERAPC